MEQIKSKDNELIFKTEISSGLANAIRRYINKISVLAIDEVEISKNDTALYDEAVAHRLGLVPIKTKEKLKEDSEINLTLSSKKEGIVYSSELKGKAEPVYGGMPITKLEKGQEIELKAKAVMGEGRTHAKFSPGFMVYRNASSVILDKKHLEKIKKLCPQAKIEEKGDKIVVLDQDEKSIIDLCEGIIHHEGKEAETEDGNELIISIESFGHLEPKEIFVKSIEKLKKDLTDLGKQIGK